MVIDWVVVNFVFCKINEMKIKSLLYFLNKFLLIG